MEEKSVKIIEEAVNLGFQKGITIKDLEKVDKYLEDKVNFREDKDNIDIVK